jgi:hypothetical protein
MRSYNRTLTVLLGVCLMLALSAVQASAQLTTTSFTAKGCSNWIVPSGVTSVQISAVGAAGVTILNGTATNSGGTGDGVSATLSGLSTGDNLRVCVDFGGGTGGTAANGDDGGAGGGASGVALGSDFTSPVLIAGGGGAGGFGVGTSGGGSAGSPSGGPGNNSGAGLDGGGGGGGTNMTGGIGGATGVACVGHCTDSSNGFQFSNAGPGIGGGGGGGSASNEVAGGGGGAG